MASTPAFERVNTVKQPSGNNLVLVGWTGTKAVAATSGDERAFAVSTDDGATFNDISLIDTVISAMSDAAVSADGSKVYLATYDAAVSGTSDVSIWVKDGIWARVLSLRDMPTAHAAYLVRIAPEDSKVVYVSSAGGQDMWLDMWVSKDSGKASWTYVPSYRGKCRNYVKEL